MLTRKPSRRPRVTPSRIIEPDPDQAIPAAGTSAPRRWFQNADLAARRARVRKRQTERAPAATPRNVRFRIYVSYRWLSAALFILLVGALYLMLTLPVFFIRSIKVAGTKYLTPNEIVQRSELGNVHIFWVDPDEVERLLERDPSIADADVRLGWFPNLVQINITEREPALVWEQAEARVWLDVQGRVIAPRADLPDLVLVSVKNPSDTIHLGRCALQGTKEVLGPQNCIDESTVAGALSFKALYPDVARMVYDPNKGLGFEDGRNWTLWFGDGTDIQTKMLVYTRIVEEEYTKKGTQFIEVNVTDPDAPYFSIAPG